MGRWQLIIVSVYVHCKTHRKRSDIEMNETLNLHRQRTKWTADIELDNYKIYFCNWQHQIYIYRVFLKDGKKVITLFDTKIGLNWYS